MGGFIAQYFAATFPEKVISLALLSSILTMNKAGKQFLDQIIEDARHNPDALLQRIFAMGGVRQTRAYYDR